MTFKFTHRFVTLQLAFRSRTNGRFLTIPTTRRFFTNRRAVCFRCFTNGVTACGSTDGLTFRTRGGGFSRECALPNVSTPSTDGGDFEAFAARHRISGTTNGTFRLFAVYLTLGTRRCLTLHLTTRTFTDGMTYGGTARIITLPATGRMAHFLLTHFTITRITRNTRARAGTRSSHCAFAEFGVTTTVIRCAIINGITFLNAVSGITLRTHTRE